MNMDLTVALDKMDPTVAGIIVTTMCSTLVTLAVALLNYIREGRAHTWAREQAEFEANQRRAVAEDLKLHTDRKAEELAVSIAENTDISVTAFKEANDVNRKIAAIGGLRQKARE